MFYVSQGQLSRVRITLPEATNPGLRDNVVCHEFMHATTGIPDNYGARPDTSCVWGDLSAPGSFDAQYAHQVYKQKDQKASGGKKHGGKHHGGKHHGGKKHGGRVVLAGGGDEVPTRLYPGHPWSGVLTEGTVTPRSSPPRYPASPGAAPHLRRLT